VWRKGLQRLFSTFAEGWPGVGLLVQRLLTGVALLYQGIAIFEQAWVPSTGVPQIMGAVLGIFILAGLWTPVAGALVAVVEVWLAAASAGDPCISIALATLGGSLAMIGPGAWSIDARLFGRKHFGS